MRGAHEARRATGLFPQPGSPLILQAEEGSGK
jgi:hypothetical protein